MRSPQPKSDPLKGSFIPCLFLRLLVALTAIVVVNASSVRAQHQERGGIGGNEKDWHAEFDEICSHVDGAMDMNREELESLLSRCRVLEPRIEQLPRIPKKVFTRRLQMCRDLYQFVLEQKAGNTMERSAGGNTAAAGGDSSAGRR